MLTHDELVDLYRANRAEKVLSVYLTAEQHDPAERNAWRRLLDHGVTEAREPLDSNDERAAFDAAFRLLESALDRFDAFLPERGWVGFATADQLLYTESVPVPMPNLVRWEPGLRVAPYVRALKQERPVVTVLTDSRRARVFRYHDGQFAEQLDLRADMFLGDLSDTETSKRAATHTGIRGATGTDTAQRLHEVGSERMLKQLVDVLGGAAGRHGFVVLGGTPEMVAATASRLPKGLATRAMERPSLHFDMTLAEVKEATQTAASELTHQHQNELLENVLDAARAHGRGCLGREETERALGERRVESLLLSRRFILANADYADHCVGTAFEQGADVEELSGEAGERLDAEAGGIGAVLRYRI
jgi:hypothetical protein